MKTSFYNRYRELTKQNYYMFKKFRDARSHSLELSRDYPNWRSLTTKVLVFKPDDEYSIEIPSRQHK